MKKRETRRVTQADIARRVGVHQTTVSAVLRGNAPIYVAEETRRRILETAARAGYPLRAHAVPGTEQPPGKMANTLGILNFSTPSGAGAERLRQAAMAVEEAGFHAFVTDVGWVSDGGSMACDTLLRIGVEGAILCGLNDYFDLRQITRFHQHKIPVAAISAATVPGALTLASDREAGFEALVHHLAESGRRNLWLSTFPLTRPSSIPSHDAQLSVSHGFRKAARKLGLRHSCRVVRGKDHPGAGYSHHEFGHRAMHTLLAEAKQRERPEAVLCFGDSWALGAVRACQESDISIPNDLALTGYGGESFTEFMTPSLTTIATPFQALARLAVENIVAALRTRTRSLGGTLLLPGELIVRESTAAGAPSPL